jgi:1-deoxy-D-xylulose-5-phosphate synthase
VIGDGALTGGMAFEALNDAGRSPNNLLVILNDNEMSISKNVGGLSRYLSKIRTQPIYYKAKEDLDNILVRIPAIGKGAARALDRAKGTIKYLLTPGVIFEELGFKYLGPIDGHDISELCQVLSSTKLMKGPVLIHVCTQKGKGYSFAEEKPDEFHGISPFEIETGEVKINNGPTYSDVFGKAMIQLAEAEPGLCAVTAAMPHGTGLSDFSRKFPERFFDVGIAEQHAVTFAAGLANNGITPVVAIYSSFLQRSYDQILHDVALQNLHVVFAIDRAGVVGEDGETHQGIYDLSFLSHIPNMTIASPCDYDEFIKLLEYAVVRHKGPIAVRYPRGVGVQKLSECSPFEYGRGVKMLNGNDITIAGIGNTVETALKCSELLKLKGIKAEVLNMRFVKPLDKKLLIESAEKTGSVMTIEDNSAKGGFGSNVLELLNNSKSSAKVRIIGYPDIPIMQGSRSSLYRKYGLDAESLANEVLKMLGR